MISEVPVSRFYELSHLSVVLRGDFSDHGSLPAPSISLLSPCATDGYAAAFRRRKSRGNSERSSHKPAATAAAHVTDTSPSCIRSAQRVPCPEAGKGTIFPTSTQIPPATIAVSAALPISPQRNSSSRTNFL